MKWGFIPQGPTGPAAKPQVPRDQRRRGRAGHLQGHPADDGRPALADRGLHHHLATRSARTSARSTSAARRVHAAAPAAQRGRARPTPPGYLGTRHPRLRLRPRHRRARRRRRLHLRRGDGAARLAGGPPRPAPAQAAVPGHRRASTPAPTVVNNVETIATRAVDRAGRRRLVPDDGHREVARPEDLLAVRARHPARASTRPRWAPRCASCSSWPAA